MQLVLTTSWYRTLNKMFTGLEFPSRAFLMKEDITYCHIKDNYVVVSAYSVVMLLDVMIVAKEM